MFAIIIHNDMMRHKIKTDHLCVALYAPENKRREEHFLATHAQLLTQAKRIKRLVRRLTYIDTGNESRTNLDRVGDDERRVLLLDVCDVQV